MSDVETSAGATISIGSGTPATFNKVGYDALTFTEIGEVSNISGDLGKVFSLATFQLLKERGLVKRKGGYNNGAVTVEYGYHRSDTGQAALVTAANADATYAFKIILEDADTTEIFFMAMAMGAPINIGGADDFLTSAVVLEVDSESDVLFEDP